MVLINPNRVTVPSHLTELNWVSFVRNQQRWVFVLTYGRKL